MTANTNTDCEAMHVVPLKGIRQIYFGLFVYPHPIVLSLTLPGATWNCAKDRRARIGPKSGFNEWNKDCDSSFSSPELRSPTPRHLNWGRGLKAKYPTVLSPHATCSWADSAYWWCAEELKSGSGLSITGENYPQSQPTRLGA